MNFCTQTFYANLMFQKHSKAQYTYTYDYILPSVNKSNLTMYYVTIMSRTILLKILEFNWTVSCTLMITMLYCFSEHLKKLGSIWYLMFLFFTTDSFMFLKSTLLNPKLIIHLSVTLTNLSRTERILRKIAMSFEQTFNKFQDKHTWYILVRWDVSKLHCR